MANVPLRVYSREIENLVESGHLDEAIAECCAAEMAETAEAAAPEPIPG